MGNCQALALANVYRAYIAPWRDEDVQFWDLNPHMESSVAMERVGQIRLADVIVEQHFDSSSWIELDELRPSTRRIGFPYVGGAFLWPFGGNDTHVRNMPHPPFCQEGPYPAEIGDRALNRMILAGVPAREAVQRYLDMDVVKAGRADRLFELHMDMQRRQDEATGLNVADHIQARFRTNNLFLTKGHLSLDLFRFQASWVFERMDAPYSLIETALRSLRAPPFPVDELPIHPALADHLGLAFANRNRRYRFRREGAFTFEEWAERYMDYAWAPDLAEGIWLTHGGGTPAQALPLLEAGLARCPTSVAGWLAFGLTLARLGRSEAADEAVDRARSLDPADPEGPRTRAIIRLLHGRHAEAALAAREAIDLFPFDGASHRTLADALARAGDLAGAAQIAGHAARVQPGDPGGWSMQGEFLTRMGRHAEALAPVRALVAMAPGEARHHGQLGRTLAPTGDHSGAEAAYRTAMALDPENLEFQGGLASALDGLGRRPEAIELVRAALDTGRADSHMHNRLGYLLAKDGDWRRAEAAYRQAIALDRSVPGFHVSLADMLARQGRPDEGAAVLRDAREGGLDDPRIASRLDELMQPAV